eukprot:COSAG01_NODE_36955_length_510_cov_1.026764_2_plen_92_part_01
MECVTAISEVVLNQRHSTFQDPVTGVPQDPDNTYMLTSWGEDPPGHAGAFVFGTEHDMVDRGEESGTYRGQYRGGPHTITIPQTTVTPSNFI